MARENYSFIVRAEKEARLALAAKLHKTAEPVFGVHRHAADPAALGQPPRGLAADSFSSLIVGTAGHIDHGKSALVRALTGTDPDRLKEEKERGITIDLGFAHLDLRLGPGGLLHRRARATSGSCATCWRAPTASTRCCWWWPPTSR